MRALALYSVLPSALVVLAASNTLAATLVVPTPYVIAGKPYPQKESDFSVAVPKFNPALGTLTGATVAISNTAGVDVYEIPFFFVANGSVVRVNLTKQTVFLGQPNTASFPSVSEDFLVSADASGGPYTGVASSTNNVYLGTATVAISGSYDVTGAQLAALTGTGTTPIGYTIALDSGASFFNETSARADTAVGAQTGTVTVTYTYVPEPALLSLAASLPILLGRRRRVAAIDS